MENRKQKLKRRVRVILYIIIQLTWGIIQNILGFCCFLMHLRRQHYFYHGAIVTNWNNKMLSMNLGMFIFMRETSTQEQRFPNNSMSFAIRKTLLHEYGHSLQSIMLGPAFLFVIGLPSTIWAIHPYFRRKRK